MPIRIGTTPTPSMPEQIEAVTQPTLLTNLNPAPATDLVSPETARYLGPEAVCATCVHFIDPSSCEVVSGDIDPQGRCCLYEADADTDTDEAADALEAMPVAEDVVPAEDEEEAY